MLDLELIKGWLLAMNAPEEVRVALERLSLRGNDALFPRRMEPENAPKASRNRLPEVYESPIWPCDICGDTLRYTKDRKCVVCGVVRGKNLLPEAKEESKPEEKDFTCPKTGRTFYKLKANDLATLVEELKTLTFDEVGGRHDVSSGTVKSFLRANGIDSAQFNKQSGKRVKEYPRNAARRLGNKRYHGAPCISCGETEKTTSSGACVRCTQARTRLCRGKANSSVTNGIDQWQEETPSAPAMQANVLTVLPEGAAGTEVEKSDDLEQAHPRLMAMGAEAVKQELKREGSLARTALVIGVAFDSLVYFLNLHDVDYETFLPSEKVVSFESARRTIVNELSKLQEPGSPGRVENIRVVWPSGVNYGGLNSYPDTPPYNYSDRAVYAISLRRGSSASDALSGGI